MKAQQNIMEYVVLMFFIFVILAVIMFFLYGWQISQSQLSSAKESIERGVELSETIMNSPYFIKGSEMAMLDDARLTAMNETDGICDKLINIFGPDWSLEVQILGENEKIECTQERYPDCNAWTICKQDREGATYVLPVNIYRKTEKRTDIGVMMVGIYEE